MERIRLTKEEKTVLRMVAGKVKPKEFPEHVYLSCVRRLERLGLVEAFWVEEKDTPAEVLLSDTGAMYLAENPSLRNPTDWKWVVTTAIAVVGAGTAIAALFVACGNVN